MAQISKSKTQHHHKLPYSSHTTPYKAGFEGWVFLTHFHLLLTSVYVIPVQVPVTLGNNLIRHNYHIDGMY